MASLMNDPALDGEFYIGDNVPPEVQEETQSETDEFEPGDEINHRELRSPPTTVVYKRLLMRWKDPTSLPHTRTVCAKKWKYPGGWTCTGWKVEYQYIYRSATLIVEVKKGLNPKKDIEDCLKIAAIIALVAAIYSGGSAAGPAAASAIKECLLRKLAQGLIDLRIDMKTVRGKWE